MPGAARFHLAFTSPLPLLGPAAPSASLLVQRIDLGALPGSAIAGTATLKLSRDRKTLILGLDATGRFAAAIPDVFLVLPPGGNAGTRDDTGGAAILLAFRRAPGAPIRLTLEAGFDLADPTVARGPAVADFAAAACRHAARDHFVIDGMTVAPAARPAAQPKLCLPGICTADFPGPGGRQDPAAYFRRRMTDETECALRAESAAAAAIHVRLATLYARNVRGDGADRAARAFGSTG